MLGRFHFITEQELPAADAVNACYDDATISAGRAAALPALALVAAALFGLS